VTDDPEDRDPGLARQRTALAWTRTAISFAALGGAVLKTNVVGGAIILAIAPLIWQLGRLRRPGGRLGLITAAIVVVSLVALVLSVLAQGPGVHLR